MNQPLRISIISSLLISLYACTDIQPVSTPLDPLKPNIQPPVAAAKCPMLAEKIIGSWRLTTTRLLNAHGGSTNYSGRITLNADKTLSDPDTVLGYKIEDELVIRKGYELLGDSLIIFVADRLERQVGILMNLQADQCYTPKFINIGSGGATTELIR